MPKKDNKERDETSSDSLEQEPDEPVEANGDESESRSANPPRRERPDNLRRRSEWFQKRTGGGS